jgi:zinc protease
MKKTTQTFSCLALLCLTAAVANAQGPDRSKLPSPAKATVYSAPEVKTYTLENGIEVWHVAQHQAPLISMQLVLPMGSGTDSAGKAGTASVMVDMLDEGTADKDAIAISDAFALIATGYGASSNTDGISFSLNMLADQLTPSLELFSEVLLKPTFPEKEFNRLKAERTSAAIQSEADPSRTGFVIARRVMYLEGFGAYSSGGTRSTLANITLDDVRGAYTKLIRLEGAAIVVVGSIEKDALLQALNATLGKWVEKAKPTEAAVEAEVSAESAPRGIHIVDFPGSSQSMVILSRRAPGNSSDDYFQSAVFNRQFAGSFTGRVNMNLREDKGYTYGARGSFMRNNKTGTYTIYAKVKGDTTRASVDEILKELTWVYGEKPLTAEELEAAKGAMLKSFPGRFERMSGVAGQLTSTRTQGHGTDWFAKWPSKVNSIDLAAASSAGKKYTDPESFHIIIAGDYAKIGESLKGLDMPIFFYDTQGNRIEKEAK